MDRWAAIRTADFGGRDNLASRRPTATSDRRRQISHPPGNHRLAALGKHLGPLTGAGVDFLYERLLIHGLISSSKIMVLKHLQLEPPRLRPCFIERRQLTTREKP